MDELEMRMMSFKNSVIAVLEMLVEELTKSGAISAAQFSERLAVAAKGMEEEWRDSPGVWDVDLVRSLARGLKPDYPTGIVENPEPPKPDNENP